MICKKENNHEYIIVEELPKTDNFALQMLLENELPGFVSCRRQLFNAKAQLYYDISAKRPLSDGALLLHAEQLKRLLQSMLCALQTVSSYFLEAEGISLQPDTIFEERGEWYFCYFLTNEGAFEDRLLSLCEYLLSKVDQNDEKAVVLVYRFYQAVKRREGLPEHILKNILFDDRGEEEIEPGIQAQPPAQSPAQPSAEGADLFDAEPTAEEAPRQKAAPDPISLAAFSLLTMGSAGYGMIFCLRQQVTSPFDFLQFRQGLLCAVFFLLGMIGVGVCLWTAGMIPIKRDSAQSADEQEVFEIPPIDKI